MAAKSLVKARRNGIMTYAMAALVLLLVLLAAELLLRVRHRTLRGALPSELRTETQGIVWGDIRDKYHIVCLGDSNTYGEGLAYALAYPAILEALLRERHPETDVVVINAGIRGNTAVQGLARLQDDVLRYSPQVVVSAFGLNDGNLGHWPLDRLRERQMYRETTLQGRIDSWLQSSHLYRTLAARIKRAPRQLAIWGPSPVDDGTLAGEPQPRVSPQGFALAQRRIVSRIHSYGGVTFLMTTTPVTAPSQPDPGPAERKRQIAVYKDYDQKIRELAQESNPACAGRSTSWHLIDLYTAVAIRSDEEVVPLVAADGVHLTAAGHRLAASIILQALEDSGLLHSQPYLRR